MKTTTILISCALLGGAALAQAKDRPFGDGTLPEFLAQCDLDGNGVLDEEEVQAMKQLREQAREEKRAAIDTDGDGKICEQEREQARLAMQAEILARRTEKFQGIAGDDGVLTRAEFGAIPALADVDPAQVDAMFARLDADGNGEVTLEEFLARLRQHQGPCPGPGPGDGEPIEGGPRPGPGPGPGDGGPGPGPGEGPGDGPRK